MSAVKDSRPYNFDPVFEKAVAFLACNNPRFYGRVGTSLDPELFKTDASKLAVRVAHVIYKDSGHGPSAGVLVLQRLRAWMADGKCTIQAIKDVAELFDDVEDTGVPDPDGVIVELTPLLQQRLRDEAVQLGIESFGKNGDLSRVVALEEKAVRIGTVDTSVGTMLGPDSWAEISALRDQERLPLGVVELDSGLEGGLARGGLGVLVGGSGDGKSMMLSHIGGVNLVGGLFIGYATLELPRATILARIKANMTGIPINALVHGEHADAKARLQQLAGKLGRFVVKDFTPYATTVEDIFEWVDQCEQFCGRKMDLLIVDYGDKVGAKSKKGEQASSEYTSGRVVFEGLRIWADERKTFCWTASQANRQKDKKKRLDLNDTADSMHKIRVADLVVTLNLKEEGESTSILFYVGKHRTGRSRFEIGPLPTAYELGQVVSL